MNTYPSTPKLRPTLWDGVVAALVAALAIVTILCFYGRRTGAPQAVTITHRGALIQTIRLTGLTETKTVAIDGSKAYRTAPFHTGRLAAGFPGLHRQEEDHRGG